jgi:hypothetical protein
MIARVGAGLALLAAIAIGCGKYGPPVRVQPEAESPDPAAAVAPTDDDDSSEEETDPQGRQP